MPAPTPDQDDFEAPESDSARKLARHLASEMPIHVIIAVAIVAFLFFYGMANSLLRLLGRELDPAAGLVFGAAGSAALTVLIFRLRRRRP